MRSATANPTAANSPKAPPLYFVEITILRLVLANPELIGEIGEVRITYRQARRVITTMRAIAASGLTPTADLLDRHLADDPKLAEQVAQQRTIGELIPRPAEALRRVLADHAHLTSPGVQEYYDEVRRRLKAADPGDAITTRALLLALDQGPPNCPPASHMLPRRPA